MKYEPTEKEFKELSILLVSIQKGIWKLQGEFKVLLAFLEDFDLKKGGSP